MRRSAPAALAALSILAACESGQNPLDVDFQRPAAVAVALPTVTSGEVIVCKEGPAGDYTFSVTGTANVNVIANPATVAAGTCELVAETQIKGESVTVTETGLAGGTQFVQADVYFWRPNASTETGTPSFDRTETDPSVTVSPNNDAGWVIIYRNEAIPTDAGCTLTQGYWKNHVRNWPSGSDPDAAFFASGKTWLKLLKSPPKGDAYIILAHQYIAASLNELNGASVPAEVQTALDNATAYFSGGSATRAQLISWADLLDRYNNGRVGPGHCDD